MLHLSATPYGGGVAELLATHVPLLRSVGVDADWQVIHGSDEFFGVTKNVHNALQGADEPFDDRARLVAKEGPVVNERDAPLCPSRDAGAFDELGEDVIPVQPSDLVQTAGALANALELPTEERRARAARLRTRIGARSPRDWLAAQIGHASWPGGSAVQRTRERSEHLREPVRAIDDEVAVLVEFGRRLGGPHPDAQRRVEHPVCDEFRRGPERRHVAVVVARDDERLRRLEPIAHRARRPEHEVAHRRALVDRYERAELEGHATGGEGQTGALGHGDRPPNRRPGGAGVLTPVQGHRNAALLLDPHVGQRGAGLAGDAHEIEVAERLAHAGIHDRRAAGPLAFHPVLTEQHGAAHRHRLAQELDRTAAHDRDGPHPTGQPTQRVDRLREGPRGGRVIDDRRQRSVEVEDDADRGRARDDRGERGADPPSRQVPMMTRQLARSAPVGTGEGIGFTTAVELTTVAIVVHSRWNPDA